MNIIKLQIKKLHGYIDKTILFDSKINILVGINGSGKTSVLNIISWLLQPSIPNLCTTVFDSITLDFIFDNHKCVICCTQTDRELKYVLTHPSRKNLQPLVVQLMHLGESFRQIRTNQTDDIRRSMYSALKPEKKELSTWRLIQKIPSPIVVGLERTVGGDGVELHISESKAISLGAMPESESGRDENNPMRRVKQLARDAFSRYRAHMLTLNNSFRDQIMVSAFDTGMLDGISHTKKTSKQPTLKIGEVEALEVRIATFFAQESQFRQKHFGGDEENIGKIANTYLLKLKRILNESEKHKGRDHDSGTQIVLASQVARITKLLQEAESLDANSKQAATEIDRYVKSINRFLIDSAKELYFDQATGNLSFRLTDKQGVVIAEDRAVDVLSSGEKQILILLTYLAFIPGKVFIIDEPELSLHPKWQEEFMEAMKTLMPEGTQLILATHSPALVGKNSNFCKVLLPYNE